MGRSCAEREGIFNGNEFAKEQVIFAQRENLLISCAAWRRNGPWRHPPLPLQVRHGGNVQATRHCGWRAAAQRRERQEALTQSSPSCGGDSGPSSCCRCFRARTSASVRLGTARDRLELSCQATGRRADERCFWPIRQFCCRAARTVASCLLRLGLPG